MIKKEFDRDHFNFAVPIDSIATDGDQPDAARTFDGIAYSGAVIPRHFVFQNLYIDLDSIQAKSQIPIFRDHDASLVAGHGSLYKDAQNKLRVSGTLSRNSIGSDITQLADEGFAWEMSIGAVPEYIEEVQPGKTVFINGEEVNTGATIFRGTRVLEVSFTPIGADSNTEVSVFSQDGIEKDIETITVEVREMDNEIKPVEAAEVVAPEIEIKETVAAEVTEEITEEVETAVEATEEDLKLTVERLTAELACSCTEKKAAKSDLEKAQDTIKELKSEIEELRSKKKKEDFSSKAADLGIKLSSDQVEFFFSELNEDDKFDKVLAILSEQASNSKPALPVELTKNSQVEVNFGNKQDSQDSGTIAAQAKALQAKLAEKGESIEFSTAVARVSNWSM